MVGNTLGPNTMVELSQAVAGKTSAVLGSKVVDKGAAGAIFGMLATGKSAATARLYFNDDNSNSLQVLQP